LTTGDTLSFLDDGSGNGSHGTFTDGTFYWNNGACLDVVDDSEVDITPQLVNVMFNAQQGAGSQINVIRGRLRFIGTKDTLANYQPVNIDGGTLLVRCVGATVHVTGDVANDSSKGSVYMSTAATGNLAIRNGATLEVADGVVAMGGKISTPWTQTSTAATIEGDVANYGADVVILDGTSPRPLVGGSAMFGQLLVDGNVTWTGGTYRPVVNATQGSLQEVWTQDTSSSSWVLDRYADRWNATGTFTISGTPSIAPGTVNGANGQLNPWPNRGLAWIVITAGNLALCSPVSYASPWTGVTTAWADNGVFNPAPANPNWLVVTS
jgi:hypothetical protein